MEFRILGPLEIVVDAAPVRLSAAKQQTLLGCLLVHAGEVVSADALVDALWGERPPASARKLLQVYVSQVRKTLPEWRLLTQPPGYLLVVEPHELDARRFELLLADGRAALAEANPALAAALLERALALWRGPALADFAYETFAAGEAERLEELRLACLEGRIEAQLALGRHSELVGELQALATTHPQRERLREQLMLSLYRTGRQVEALEAYHDARKALEELGLEPGPELRRLQQAILRQDLALTIEDSTRSTGASLPASPTPLVGRSRELQELQDVLRRPEVRLLTLSGTGGVGKTRLALEVARGLGGAFANGALLVELASIADPTLVVHAIAHSAGIKETPGQAPLDGLAEQLRGQELLLVLDNFEHLLPATGTLTGSSPAAAG